MNDRYRLGGLENDQLLAAVAALVKRENDSLSDLLAHLAELDERGLCLELGYPSLFAYCTEALRFCKSSAGRRIAAARLCRQYPEAFVLVANGELQLSVLCALRPHLNADNAAELFAACCRKSYEQVEELLAARFPRPDVRDSVRRLPTGAVSAPDIGTSLAAAEPTSPPGAPPSPPAEEPRHHDGGTGARQPVAAMDLALPTMRQSAGDGRPSAGDGRPSAGDGRPSAGDGPQSAGNGRGPARSGAVKPLSPGRFSVNFTADQEFRELLEEVRALISHAEPQGDLLTVMRRGLQALRGELLKRRFGVGRKPRRVRLRASESRSASASAKGQIQKRTRHVAAAVARKVYERDQGPCTFCADDGRRCDERRLLQLDHVIPYAAGGEATVANLRLRCRAHNLHAARGHFGAEHVRAAMARAGEGARHGRFDEGVPASRSTDRA